MEFSHDSSSERSAFSALLVPSVLMFLLYIAAISGAILPLLLLSKLGFPHNIFFWILNSVFMVAVGLLAIWAMGGSFAGHGFTLGEDRSYIPHTIIFGAAAAVVHSIISLITFLHTQGGIQAAFPGYPVRIHDISGIVEPVLIGIMFGIAQAVLLIGVVQVYLMRKSAAHVRLGRWEVHAAGIAVCCIAVLSYVVPTIHGFRLGIPYFMSEMVDKAILCCVILASAYWFEKSRSLVAPVLAFGVYYGGGQLVSLILYKIIS
jgi:hypothetical protein